jgi:hypothetical protein
MGAALDAALASLRFPFEAQCTSAVLNATRGAILIDLPKIEDVSDERETRYLKNGDTREIKRTKIERNREYTEIVARLTLLVVRTTFNALPSMHDLYVAGSTQRRDRRSGESIDEFVFEMDLDRQCAEFISPQTDPFAFLKTAQRIQQTESLDLKKISPPSWLSAVRGIDMHVG